MGGWVGGWGWVEEKKAVRTRCCMYMGLGVCVWVGGWVGEEEDCCRRAMRRMTTSCALVVEVR